MVPRSVARFCVAALGASMASAVLAGTLVGAGADFYMSWLTTVLLGMLIVTPPIVMLARMVGTNALGNTPPAMKAEATAILTAAGLVTIAAFPQAEFPATFLPCIAVVAAAYRLGPFRAVAGVPLVPTTPPPLPGPGHGPRRPAGG